MKLRIEWKKLLICIAIPLAVGGLSALLTSGNMDLYSEINQPALAPPSWLFPVVWTILYVLMGVALYLVVVTKTREDKRNAIISFGVQLFFNFFWSLIFFNARAFLFAFVWLVFLWISIIANIYFFYKINKNSGKLLIPYLLWVTFAGYLNFAIFLLNR
ncbi:MAG: tryptophan-rich sensory protein [Clostridia bacterium]|nr:tryptophan-rich sensory protein [Clostridia bacterium]